MWLQEYQRNLSEQAQKMFAKLCKEHLPYSGPVDIDGIVCITACSDSSKQIVVKIHQSLGQVIKTERLGEPELAREACSPFLNTSNGIDIQKDGPHIYTDTPSPNLPKDSHRLQSPEIPHDENNTLSMSLKIETESMDSEVSDSDGHIHASRTPIWSKQQQGSSGAGVESRKHPAMSPHRGSSNKTLLSTGSKLGSTFTKAFNSTSMYGGNNTRSTSRSGSIILASIGSALKPSSMFSSSALAHANRTKVPLTSGNLPYENATLNCKFCPGRYNGFRALQSHLEESHKRYLCKQCLSTFSMRCNLRRHERLHAGLKPYRCNQCSKSFARSTDLKIHVAKHAASPSPNPLQCSKCPQVFSNSEALCKHLYSVHKDQEGIIACNKCGQLFSDAGQLEKHEESRCEARQVLNGDSHQHNTLQATTDEEDQEQLASSASFNGSDKPTPGKPEVEDSQNVKSVLQQLLFNSERTLNKRIEARNIIQMDSDDSALLIDEEAHSFEMDEKDAKLSEYDEQEAYENAALNHDTSDHAMSTSSLSPTATSRSSTPKKNRRKKGKPVRVICMEEQDGINEEDFEDQMMEEIEDMTAIEDAGNNNSLQMASLSHGNGEFEEHANEEKMAELKHYMTEGYPSDSEESFGVLDLSTPHPNAGNSLNMLQQLIPKPQLDRSPKVEATQYVVPKDLPITVPSPRRKPKTNGTASPSPVTKVKKGGNSPAPIDPDDLVYRVYTCHSPGCTVKLTNFRDYDEHSVTEHLRYPCKLCRSSFTGRNNRTRHMRHHHGGSKSHICGDCGKSFARSDSLREHQYIHTKSYHDQKCHNCGIRCEKKVLLLAHLKKCYGKSRSSKASLAQAEQKASASPGASK